MKNKGLVRTKQF